MENFIYLELTDHIAVISFNVVGMEALGAGNPAEIGQVDHVVADIAGIGLI